MNRRRFLALPFASPLLHSWQDSGAPPAAIEHWKDLRFGMFIHWGPVSIAGTEIGWSRGGERRGRKDAKTGEVPVCVYYALYRKFNPQKFNAGDWVKLAKDAGMNYMVFTSRHHDGFSEFDTKYSDYKITAPDCPYGKDIVRQVADACHRSGMEFGIYYSQPDWHHADYRNGEDAHKRFITYMHNQVRELCTNYGKVSMWFFDGLGGKAEDWDAGPMLRMMRELQPGIIINNRAGLKADNDTPEQRIGFSQFDRPWETCATVGQQWSYKPNERLRPIEECLRGLVMSAIGDGNFLFNVGPRPDGLIEASHAARLREMGLFLSKYGKSIYATRGGPFVAPDEKKRPAGARGFALPEGNWWGGSTHKGNTVYLHILRWPGDAIVLPPTEQKIVKSRILTGGKVMVKQSTAGIQVRVAAEHRHGIDTIVQLDFNAPVVLKEM